MARSKQRRIWRPPGIGTEIWSPFFLPRNGKNPDKTIKQDGRPEWNGSLQTKWSKPPLESGRGRPDKTGRGGSDKTGRTRRSPRKAEGVSGKTWQFPIGKWTRHNRQDGTRRSDKTGFQTRQEVQTRQEFRQDGSSDKTGVQTRRKVQTRQKFRQDGSSDKTEVQTRQEFRQDEKFRQDGSSDKTGVQTRREFRQDESSDKNGNAMHCSY